MNQAMPPSNRPQLLVTSSQVDEIRRLHRDGEACRVQGQFDKAERVFRLALTLVDDHGLDHHPVATSVMNSLGVLYKFTGAFDQSERFYHVVRSRLEASGDRRGLAGVYHNLGGLEHARGRAEQGEVFARHGLAVREEVMGPDHPEVAADLAALAAILDAQGRFEESLPLYRRALRILHRHGDFRRELDAVGQSETQEIAVIVNNLGAVWFRRGDFRKARAAYRRALFLKEQSLGAKHPDVAVTLNNLAILHKRLGELEAAESLALRSLDILRNVLGESHPQVTACHRNLEKISSARRG